MFIVTLHYVILIFFLKGEIQDSSKLVLKILLRDRKKNFPSEMKREKRKRSRKEEQRRKKVKKHKKKRKKSRGNLLLLPYKECYRMEYEIKVQN